MKKNKKEILVVEDELDLQEAIKLKLTKAGVKVFTASTGKEALKILQRKKPVLVWLDIILPDINGLEVLKNIRKNSKLNNLPVVVVSVSSGPERIKEAFLLGVVDYIVKTDYTIEKIVDIMANLANKLSLDNDKPAPVMQICPAPPRKKAGSKKLKK